MSRARRTLHWARRLVGYLPLSWAGLAVGLGAAFTLSRYGLDQADFTLRAGCFVVLAVLGCAMLFVLLGALVFNLSLGQALKRHLEHDLDVGADLSTGLRIPRFKWWPFIDISLEWLDPPGFEPRLVVDGGQYVEQVTAVERGRIFGITRRFTIRDVFGLSAFSLIKHQTAAIRVAPAMGDTELAVALRHSSGDGYSHPSGKPVGEMIEMRRYSAGDPLRFVLWKAYARTRKLLVRTPERALMPQPSAVGYFVAGERDEPTASTTRYFLERGLLGQSFSFVADGAPGIATNTADALEAVIDSVHHRAHGGEGLDRLAAAVDPRQLGHCVFFVPASDGPWLDRLAAFSRTLPAPPSIVLAVDDELEPPSRGGTRRWWQEAPTVSRELSKLPALYDRLRATGGEVRIVHRPTGRLIGPVELDALRRL